MLVLGRPGLGIRCQQEDLLHLTMVLLGEEAAVKRESTLWEITGLPLEADVGATLSTLAELWPWRAQLVKAIPRGNTRALIVRAAQPPPDTVVTMGRWLLAVSPAVKRPQRQQERLQFSWQKPEGAGQRTTTEWSEKPLLNGGGVHAVGAEAPLGMQPPAPSIPSTMLDTPDTQERV